jgi:predicted DCC family thiol-disulfide oxidoreductase YuxK
MTPALYAACEQAVHVVKDDGTVLRAGRATLFILENIGWRWAARLLLLPPFLWFVELGYALVARNRPFFSRFVFTKEADDASSDDAR